MTELTTYDPSQALAVQMDFARMVTGGDNRAGSILPDAYKGNPANVLIAVGLGQAMGLSPAESLYRISVIKGKPSASAELIAANVRKAGHKLRVRVQEDPPQASCTIIRADDPDEPITITRDMAWATRMGLVNEPNYKKQPATMLSYRAISACARLACPEALYGVTYTPDEASDVPDDRPAPVKPQGMDALREAVVVKSEPTQGQPETTGEALTDKTRKHLFALLAERGITDRDEQIRGMVHIIGREIESRSELTEDEGRAIIARLTSDADR